MGFLEELQPPILQTVAPGDTCKNGLQEVKHSFPGTRGSSAHQQSHFTAQKMKSGTRLLRHDLGGQVAFSTGNHTLGLITGFLTKDSARDFP